MFSSSYFTSTFLATPSSLGNHNLELEYCQVKTSSLSALVCRSPLPVELLKTVLNAKKAHLIVMKKDLYKTIFYGKASAFLSFITISSEASDINIQSARVSS